MKFTVKKTLDNPGRIVIPKNMRDYYNINQKDILELVATEEGILITKAVEVDPKGEENGVLGEKRREVDKS